MSEENIKQNVREFYDQVGWQEVSDGEYQNARYEDLRPVAQNYIHKCRLRVNRHLNPTGKYLLDAGSGPIQYPEYLTYSEGYQYRVCADISIQALTEARKRIGEHGLFVVSDVANLPFMSDVFDGVVSMHTIHHLPTEEHLQAYQGLQRVLKAGKTAVVVNGWGSSLMASIFSKSIRLTKSLRSWLRAVLKKEPRANKRSDSEEQVAVKKNTGTFVRKTSAKWLLKEIGPYMDLEISSWRSISAKISRFYIKPNKNGEKILEWLFRLEDRFPVFFGKHGYYPLIVIRKE